MPKTPLVAGIPVWTGFMVFVSTTHRATNSFPVPRIRPSSLRVCIPTHTSSFENKPFNLQRFAETAPTGVESPPSPVQVGEYTFYYYGPGGGGVSYPDLYFFNLRGKTLHITFDGPYIHDKTPSAETRKLERELLATFRLFED